jgi:uncharacterized RDD family membrane protein YckC
VSMTLPGPAPEMTVGRQGHYAGAMSRLVAFGADVGASWGLYTLGVALFNAAYKLVTGSSYNLSNHQVLAVVVLSVWEFVYYSYQWAVGGRTIGMAVFGLQVVTTEGGPIGARQAVLRTLGLALSVAFFWFAFWGIIFQRERRALDDFIAGTAVVYSWDARAARLRWMARAEGAPHGAVAHQVEQAQRLEPDTAAKS